MISRDARSRIKSKKKKGQKDVGKNFFTQLYCSMDEIPEKELSNRYKSPRRFSVGGFLYLII